MVSRFTQPHSERKPRTKVAPSRSGPRKPPNRTAAPLGAAFVWGDSGSKKKGRIYLPGSGLRPVPLFPLGQVGGS
jgi:hypothetical protein